MNYAERLLSFFFSVHEYYSSHEACTIIVLEYFISHVGRKFRYGGKAPALPRLIAMNGNIEVVWDFI